MKEESNQDRALRKLGENIWDGLAGADDRSVADALYSIANNIKYLGGGDNTDERGAVEVLAIPVGEGAKKIAEALGELAEAIRESKRV